MHISPVGSVDTAVIATGSTMFGVTLLFMIVAWIDHSFCPIRAKNLLLTTAMFIAGVLWFLGDIPMNGHMLLKSGWVRVLFCFVYTAAIIIRCYALDRVFIQNKSTRGWKYYMPIGFLLGFVIVYSIITQAMSSRLTISYIAELELCSTTKGYVYVTLGVLWLNWIIILILMLRLRKIQSTFNEFYEFLCITALGIAAMIKTNVVHYTHLKYSLIRGYRMAETLGDAAIINGIILLIMAHPVIMSVLRPREYERDWLLRLWTDGLQDICGENLNLHTNFPLYRAPKECPISSNRHGNAAIRSAVNDRSDLGEYLAMPSMEVSLGRTVSVSRKAPTLYEKHKAHLRRHSSQSINTIGAADDPFKLRQII
ncbi:hypothetical protein COEREDRAFT_87139 [Coemansia reversa NRRL 1564]|uniref:G-protein coupled receptors family 3 profile domain-containing protein n=1 Tax=Coemansia reversa (strain ATCC 12441 / NRRL 1564) TaxID=763665 RepID=A0A2G5BBQ9_COERN|nr:hypothetical protein COEREDRAFT_87139 [Coemansia reversa NRRL 1564]|eukprot:PIA16440.1 hypothetical protein COEREDRAFT_87139 [Coemansia reversa NRRL 1564]